MVGPEMAAEVVWAELLQQCTWVIFSSVKVTVESVTVTVVLMYDCNVTVEVPEDTLMVTVLFEGAVPYVS